MCFLFCSSGDGGRRSFARGHHRRKSRGQSFISRNLYSHCARDILPQPSPSHPSRGTWQRPGRNNCKSSCAMWWTSQLCLAPRSSDKLSRAGTAFLRLQPEAMLAKCSVSMQTWQGYLYLLPRPWPQGGFLGTWQHLSLRRAGRESTCAVRTYSGDLEATPLGPPLTSALLEQVRACAAVPGFSLSGEWRWPRVETQEVAVVSKS